MLITTGPAGTEAEGYPTLYPSRLRAYGAAPAHDSFVGCPAQYRAKYVDQNLPRVVEPDGPLEFGTALHEALYRMEEHAVGPEDALREVWPASQSPERLAEAVEILDKYLTRGGPMARYGTLAVEVELVAKLYEDPEFGPVYMAGVIDWLGVDVNEPRVVHWSDYKSNSRPLDPAEVREDLQMRTYDWLVHRAWRSLGLPDRPYTVAHMDAIRWNDVEVRYSDNDRAVYEEWAASIAARILRDDNPQEIIGRGCRWCPRRLDCSAYLALPGESESIAMRTTGTSPEELWEWRKQAAQLRKTLDDGIKDIDARLGQVATDEGPFVVDGHRWAVVPNETTECDVAEFHEVVGDDLFYPAVSVTKRAANAIVKDHPELAGAVEDCWVPVVIGSKVKREKVKP